MLAAADIDAARSATTEEMDSILPVGPPKAPSLTAVATEANDALAAESAALYWEDAESIADLAGDLLVFPATELADAKAACRLAEALALAFW